MDVPWSTINKQQPICEPIWGSQDFNPVPWIALVWWWLMKVSGWWASAPQNGWLRLWFLWDSCAHVWGKRPTFLYDLGGKRCLISVFHSTVFVCEKLRDTGWSASNLCRFTLSIDESKFKFQYLNALIMWYDIVTYDQCMYVVDIYIY